MTVKLALLMLRWGAATSWGIPRMRKGGKGHTLEGGRTP